MWGCPQGDPQEHTMPGHIYEAGEEVDENIDLAYQLYEMAAKCGHPAGQFEVGYYLFEGFGDVEQDYAKAVEWFEKAYQNPEMQRDHPGRRPPPTSVYAIRRAGNSSRRRCGIRVSS